MKWLYAVLVCAVIIIAVLLTITIYQAPQTVPDTNTIAVNTDAAKKFTVNETDPYEGTLDAPVTIIIASSYTCAACKEQASILDTVLALYPTQVKVVWKDLPDTIGESYTAALAGRCAQAQGKFWQYHDLLLKNQDLLGDRSIYTTWAQRLGLRIADFDSCLDKQDQKNKVDGNIIEGLQAKIQSVPAMQINNGEILEDVQQLGFLKAQLDEILMKSAQ